MAEAYGRTGRVKRGLALLQEALTLVETHDERYFEAEIRRLQGELLLMTGQQIEAEASCRRALDVARRQEARSWELRAGMSLAQILHAQARDVEACELLVPIHTAFTEDFTPPDLRETQALEGDLACADALLAGDRSPSAGSR